MPRQGHQTKSQIWGSGGIIEISTNNLVTTATFLQSERPFSGFADVSRLACQEKTTLIQFGQLDGVGVGAAETPPPRRAPPLAANR